MSEETRVSGKLYKATRISLHDSLEALHLAIMSLMPKEEEIKTEKPKSVFDTLPVSPRPR